MIYITTDGAMFLSEGSILEAQGIIFLYLSHLFFVLFQNYNFFYKAAADRSDENV